MSEWTEAIYLYVQSRNVPDRECTQHKLPLYLHCNKLMCEFCFNWHMKYRHAEEYLYVERNGNMVASRDSFYPQEVLEALIRPYRRSEDVNFLDQLSGAELQRLYGELKFR